MPLSESDLIQHAVKIGMDVYPPIVPRQERTRLNMFFEDVSAAHPKIYQNLALGDSFSISKSISAKGVPGGSVPVFALVDRGPVFVFPLLMPAPVGMIDPGGDFQDIFFDVVERFKRALPTRKYLRVGMVRELAFEADENASNYLEYVDEFAGAKLIGGQNLAVFRDDKYNIRVKFTPAVITVRHKSPALGTVVNEVKTPTLQVEVDVNNHDIRPQETDDIRETIEKATSLWPDQLLEFLNARGRRKEES